MRPPVPAGYDPALELQRKQEAYRRIQEAFDELLAENAKSLGVNQSDYKRVFWKIFETAKKDARIVSHFGREAFQLASSDFHKSVHLEIVKQMTACCLCVLYGATPQEKAKWGNDAVLTGQVENLVLKQMSVSKYRLALPLDEPLQYEPQCYTIGVFVTLCKNLPKTLPKGQSGVVKAMLQSTADELEAIYHIHCASDLWRQSMSIFRTLIEKFFVLGALERHPEADRAYVKFMNYVWNADKDEALQEEIAAAIREMPSQERPARHQYINFGWVDAIPEAGAIEGKKRYSIEGVAKLGAEFVTEKSAEALLSLYKDCNRYVHGNLYLHPVPEFAIELLKGQIIFNANVVMYQMFNVWESYYPDGKEKDEAIDYLQYFVDFIMPLLNKNAEFLLSKLGKQEKKK